jgi:hypothetical protein
MCKKQMRGMLKATEKVEEAVKRGSISSSEK